jgi:hypothetical protein
MLINDYLARLISYPFRFASDCRGSSVMTATDPGTGNRARRNA